MKLTKKQIIDILNGYAEDCHDWIVIGEAHFSDIANDIIALLNKRDKVKELK